MAVSCHGFAASQTFIQKVRAAVESRQYQKAYQLLSDAFRKQSNNSLEFDRLLGTAAFHSGYYTDAIFALERVMISAPADIESRILLARSLYKVNEHQFAKDYLVEALDHNPNESQRNEIQSLIRDLEYSLLGQSRVFSSWIDMGFGYDGNINSATSSDSIYVPANTSTSQVTGDSKDHADNFFRISTGFSSSTPVAKGYSLLTGAKLSYLHAQDYTQFNQGRATANVAIKRHLQGGSLQMGANADWFSLDDQAYRNAYGLFGHGSLHINRSSRASLFGQIQELNYTTQSIKNAERLMIGGSYTKAFKAPFSPIIKLTAKGGTVDENHNNAPHMGYDFANLNIQVRFSLPNNLKLFASAYHEERDYGGTDPLFLVTREDRYRNLSLKLVKSLANGWSFTPEVLFSTNDSNVAVQDYNRHMALFTIRKDFK